MKDFLYRCDCAKWYPRYSKRQGLRWDGEDGASPTEGSAWLDIDNDGYLDIFLANYECSSSLIFTNEMIVVAQQSRWNFEEWTEYS